jgi:adenylate cyclase
MTKVAEAIRTDRQYHNASVVSEQTLRYARDLARVTSLLHTYERLLPVTIDPTSPDLPSAQVRQAAVLFTDLRGSTAIAERLRLEPELLLEILNEHFEVTIKGVQLAGGRVEKFLGDGLMASFGVWDDRADCAASAVAAGIAVVRANEELNARRSAFWGFRLQVGVGIATGPVVAGLLGSRERCELAILGDTVNIASRLTEKADGSTVLLCPTTYRAVADRLAMGLLDDRTVRGRAADLEHYRLRLGIEEVEPQPALAL